MRHRRGSSIDFIQVKIVSPRVNSQFVVHLALWSVQRFFCILYLHIAWIVNVGYAPPPPALGRFGLFCFIKLRTFVTKKHIFGIKQYFNSLNNILLANTSL